MRKNLLSVAGAFSVGLALFGMASTSTAAQISTNFMGGGGGAGTGGGVAVDAAGPAGVAAQTGNWNNLDASSRTSFTFPTVVDNSGATAQRSGTNTTVGFSSGFTFGNGSSSSVSFGTNEDKQLYTGGVGSTGSNVTATLANVPYSTYDVYVYCRFFSAGSIADSAGTTFFGNAFASTGGYAQYAATTAGAAGSGNYALFHETTPGTTFTMTAGTGSVQVFGLQVVQTPEPASAGLLGLGGLGLLVRRRRA